MENAGKHVENMKNDGKMWWNVREWGKDAGKCEEMRNMMRTYEGMVEDGGHSEGNQRWKNAGKLALVTLRMGRSFHEEKRVLTWGITLPP